MYWAYNLHMPEIIELKIDKIEKIVTEMAKSFSSLIDQISIIKDDVAGLKSDVSELKTDVSELKTDMTDVKSDAKSFRQEFNERFDGLEEMVQIFFLEIPPRLDNHDERLEILEKRFTMSKPA